MIEHIDIPNFGSFQNFVWSNSIRDDGNNIVKFKKFNILYGRNYSGKTTLSRIFRSLQTGILPPNYQDPSFFVTTTLTKVTQGKIPVTDQDIRVYNKDFVDEHLSFLRDVSGKIIPFAIVGIENTVIEKEIAEEEQKLGSIDEKTGLRYQYANVEGAFKAKKFAYTSAESTLTAKLTNKATQPPGGIKHNPLYKDPNYHTPKIQADIAAIRAQSLQAYEEGEQKPKKRF